MEIKNWNIQPEYFYILKDENTNRYYFGQTKIGVKRLYSHLFDFTHYIVLPTATEYTDRWGGDVIGTTSKEVEKWFTETLLSYQNKNSPEKKEYEDKHWKEWHTKVDNAIAKDIDPPSHFGEYYDEGHPDIYDAKLPMFNFGVDWWKNGLGYSTIQSFEEQDLLDYILSKASSHGMTGFSTTDLDRPTFPLGWMLYGDSIHYPIYWTKYKKKHKYNIFQPEDIIIKNQWKEEKPPKGLKDFDLYWWKKYRKRPDPTRHIWYPDGWQDGNKWCYTGQMVIDYYNNIEERYPLIKKEKRKWLK
tara:strand:+ start:3074 stop:3976 length:903 start_codon:yes stop_codon:yes gene_type:complete